MLSNRVRAVLTWFLLGALASASPAVADPFELREVGVAFGLFGVLSRDPAQPLFGAELGFGAWHPEWFPVWLDPSPYLGVSTTTEGGGWVVAGVQQTFALDHRWYVAPSFGVTLYWKGDGKDLGFPLEFRSALELGREVGPWKVGLALAHLSNSRLSSKNPGAESLTLRIRRAWP